MLDFLWQQIPSTTITEILCRNNDFDGVVLDNEHGVFSNETLFQCIQVATLCNKKCFVRVTEPNKTLVRHCLDSGVDGLVFSTIENESQVDDIKKQCFFPNLGVRGFGLTRDCLWGEIERKKKVTLVAQIETVAGVRWLSCASSNKSIFDFFLVGPYDLSSSLGDPENFTSDSFKQCIKEISLHAGGDDKIGYHIVKDIESNFENLKECGMLAYSLDTLMIIESVKKLQEIKNE